MLNRRNATHAGRHGCSVAVSGRRQDVLDSAVSHLQQAGIHAIGLQGDVRKKDDCERWVETVLQRLGQLDILVNCAAGVRLPHCGAMRSKCHMIVCAARFTRLASLELKPVCITMACGLSLGTCHLHGPIACRLEHMCATMCAGNFLAPAEELSVNGFRTVMEIDAVGTFNMSRAAYPALARSKQGRVISISATLHYGATWYQVCLLVPGLPH